MDVILLDHIEDLGTVGETVKVKNGYARNYLFPRKLACEATEKKLNFYRTLIEAKKRKLAKAKDAALQQAGQLEAMTLTFLRKSRGEDFRLFGSVTNADIAAALEQKGYEIDRKRIAIPEPIKKLGDHHAVVRLHPEVTAQLKLVVQSEDEAANVE